MRCFWSAAAAYYCDYKCDVWCRQACPYYRQFSAIWNARINVAAVSQGCKGIISVAGFCHYLQDLIYKSQRAKQLRLTTQELTIVENMERYTWRDWCNGRDPFMGPNCHLP
ncbi:unnamed protein product [Cylicocyclus nassatus]|uniref:Uncharacterized protein n=1 Tax=Cylicocyclus nassatus TaxID=53992 RepID=A0AA36HDD8_CYLNA|nr:unnamed protein product [Cylicocyclus nassatus]